MADRVGAELELHFQRFAYPGDDDLVFCHENVESSAGWLQR